MKLRRVKPSDIKWPDIRVTAQFDDELYEQFRASIKEVGQIAPIIVYEVEGELIGCDGMHRCREAIEAGDRPIDVAVLPGDMLDVLTKNVFLDHLRGKTPVSQMVKVIGALYTEYNLDPDQIVEKTGLTRDYIEKLIRISQASPSVQEALDQGIIGVGHAFELSRLTFANQQEEMIAKHQIYRYKVSELHKFVDDVLKEMQVLKEQPEPAATGGARPPKTYYCEGCHGEVEPRYLRPVMLCPDCFGAVWRIAKVPEPAEAKIEEEKGGV